MCIRPNCSDFVWIKNCEGSDFVWSVYLQSDTRLTDICNIIFINHFLLTMKKIEKKEVLKNQVTISETDNIREEPDIDPFLKKKRIQNMVLRRIINQINEDESDDPPFDSHNELPR